MPHFLQALRVPEVHNKTYRNDQFANPDIVPMPSSRRTWTQASYVAYWATGGFAIYNYVTGSSLIAYGLSGKQAMGACVVSPIILGILCALCGWVGSSHHISFTVASRTSWGMYGSYFAVLIRVIPALIWDGIESLYGAEAVSTIIGTWSVKWANWSHPLAGGSLELKDLIGLLIYYALFLFTMWFPPEKLQKPFMVSCVGFTMVVTGLLIWSVHGAGGAGPYFAPDYKAEVLDGNFGWAFMFGAVAVLGNCGVVVLGQSDWTRFAKNNQKSSLVSQLWACPLFIFLVTILGVIITSASTEILGEAHWQPILLLRAIQQHYDHSASSRAAVFFASVAILLSQICVNIILNSVSSAMDLMALAPKWLNIRRGAYLVAILGICLNPWKLLVSAGTFIEVLAGFGIFYGPMAGIMVADFWIVRRRKLKMEDLYLGNSDSIYWYWHGFNLRTIATFIISFLPMFPGYIQETSNLEHPTDAAIKITTLGFILGFCISLIVYPIINFFFPPPGLGLGTTTHDENVLILPQGYDQTRPTQGTLSSPSESISENEKHDEKHGSVSFVAAV
ncbi:permease for cytosine/purines, uracil, thiamine, allantoin-domain-containing protein [Mycena latifolia]|nr:permease for cytosine/purines, uracil, thiamine, allantoin-domain-containing protein [Mycena latifolia]